MESGASDDQGGNDEEGDNLENSLDGNDSYIEDDESEAELFYLIWGNRFYIGIVI